MPEVDTKEAGPAEGQPPGLEQPLQPMAAALPPSAWCCQGRVVGVHSHAV